MLVFSNSYFHNVYVYKFCSQDSPGSPRGQHCRVNYESGEMDDDVTLFANANLSNAGSGGSSSSQSRFTPGKCGGTWQINPRTLPEVIDAIRFFS